MTRTLQRALGFGVLAVLQTTLFSRAFDMFFSGDSLYYLSRVLQGSADLLRVFTEVDYLEEYRPLPFVLFSWILYPLFGLDPRGYHVPPLLFHIASTILVFALARRLLRSDLGAAVAAIFFGTHSVGFFVTYDATMMTEFLHVFFFLVAALLFAGHVESRSRARLLGALAAFAASLLAKEAAITLAAVGLLVAVVVLEGGRPRGLRASTLVEAVRRAWPLAALAVAYLVFLLAIKGWHLFPQRPGHPHHAAFTLATVAAKSRYLVWAFNVPAQLALKKAALPQLAIAASLSPLVVAVTLWTAWGVLRRTPIVLCGLLWFLATLSPVLFLPNLTQEHYLYLPLVGIALLFGSLADAVGDRLGARPFARALLPAAFALTGAVACWHNTTNYLRDSWVANGSRITEASLASLRAARPRLAPATLLYFLPSDEKDLPWYYDNGRMFGVFYRDPTLRAQFADRGAPPPTAAPDDQRTVILRYIRPRLYDVTEAFRAELRERASVKLLASFGPGDVAFDRRQGCYPDYRVFDTPTGKAAFRTAVGRGASGREALVLVAGARVRFDVGPIAPGSALLVGVAMPLDQGDGAVARVYFESEEARVPLLARWFRGGPAGDRGWHDERLDLGRVAGRRGRIALECDSGPDLDVIGDWVAFSGLRILPAAAPPPGAAASGPRDPGWLDVAPSFVARGEVARISIDAGAMTLDCRYRVDGVEQIRRSWLTTDAGGHAAFRPADPGKWEFLAIKNALSSRWVETAAYLVVQ